MKNVLIFTLLVSAWSQAGATLGDITKAIGAGNAEALARYFDETVEIAVQDEEDVYDKNQAVNIVKKFFSQNRPQSFSQVHEGKSKGNDSQYCIGNLVTDTATYRVYIYLKVTGNQYRIQELRFDKE